MTSGICPDCKYWDESKLLSQNKVPTGSQSYKVLDSISAALRTGPYYECKKVTLSPGTTLTVTDIIVNAKGSTWYKVADVPGYSGYNYIYSERVEKAPEAAASSKLTIKPKDNSISMVQGDACPIWGNISTNGTLKTVTATLDGKQYASIKPSNQKSLDIRYSAINKDLIGSKLSVGSHTLVISATDSYGGSKSVTIPITVTPSAKLKLYAPTIIYHNRLFGGKIIVIAQNSGNPAGTKLA